MVSADRLFNETKTAMKAAGIDTYRFDAQCIMEQAFGMPLPRIFITSNDEVSEEIISKVHQMVNKRCSGQPLQYILGDWEFFGYTFKVGEGVLIPRPDTETLVEQIIDICKKKELVSPRIIDLCSGSGCIAITLKKELPSAEIYAVELSDAALPYLKENANINNTDINIIQGDVLNKETAKIFSNLDIIVCNPPYLTNDDMHNLQKEVSFEPRLALFGGDDGLDFYRKITDIWRDSLKDSGFLAYEYGLGQHNDISRILIENGFTNIQLSRDTSGINRTVLAQKKSEENYG